MRRLCSRDRECNTKHASPRLPPRISCFWFATKQNTTEFISYRAKFRLTRMCHTAVFLLRCLELQITLLKGLKSQNGLKSNEF